MKEEVKTNNAQSAPGLLSQALLSNGFIFTSGFIHSKPNGELIEGSTEEKFKQVMQNIEEVLKAANANLNDIIKATIYVTDISILPELNKLYITYFTEPYPVREAVCVQALPLGATIEMSVVQNKNNMNLEIVTPEKIIYTGEVDQIVVNTADGEITILPHHVNLFTKVLPGELTIKISDKEQFLAITGGFLEVSDNKITILADYAVHAEEIQVEKALAAQKRAEEILKKKEEGISERDFAEAQGELRKALLELHIANRRHRRNPPINK